MNAAVEFNSQGNHGSTPLAIDIMSIADAQEHSLQDGVTDKFAGVVKALRLLIESNELNVIHCPVSQGKDSTLVELACLEAYRQSIAEKMIEPGRPLIISTVDTLAEAMPMVMYVNYCKPRVEVYAKRHGINLYYDVITPPLNDEYFIKFVGGQKLVPNATRRGDCSIIMKVLPSEQHIKNLLNRFKHKADQRRYTHAQIVSCVGSRQDEGSRRAGNMQKQGIADKNIRELLQELEQVDIGKNTKILKFAPIKDWTTDEVFAALRLAGDKPLTKPYRGRSGVIPGFLSDFGLLLEIYGNGSNETCEIAVGAKQSSGCNGKARFGCVICTQVAVKDHSSIALAEYPRWQVLGADNVLRLRDYLFRLSCDMKARAFHARAYDPVGFNRVALQPNVLKPKHLEKIVRYASQLSIDAIRTANEFRQMVEQGTEFEHPGMKDIIDDRNIPPKTKRAFLEMYKECAQQPMLKLFSEAHAILLSFRWSIDGIGAAPYRPLAIWDQLLKGKGWIPYPPLNSEYERIHGPIQMVDKANPLPEAVMMKILLDEDAQSHAQSPVSLLDLWQRPIDNSDIFDADRNCTIARVANEHAELAITFSVGYTITHKTRKGAGVNGGVGVYAVCSDKLTVLEINHLVDIQQIRLDGKAVKGQAIPLLKASGVDDEVEQWCHDKIGQIYAQLNHERIIGDLPHAMRLVNEAVDKVIAGEQMLKRKLKYFKKGSLNGGFATKARKVEPKYQFTRRVTKTHKQVITKGNTRLGFYGMNRNSRTHDAHRQAHSCWTLDFGTHTTKAISMQDDAFALSDEVIMENIEVAETGIELWQDLGWGNTVIATHDRFISDLIKKRHVRGTKSREVRRYGGTHVAEALLSMGIVTIKKQYMKQLISILKRTHVFNEIGLFQFQSANMETILNHPKAVPMAQHRIDKAQVMLAIRQHRHGQTRAAKTALNALKQGNYGQQVLSDLKSNCQRVLKGADNALSELTTDFYPGALKAVFDYREVTGWERAKAARLWLTISLGNVSTMAAVLKLMLSPYQLKMLKADAPCHVDAMQFMTRELEAFEKSIADKLALWGGLIEAVKVFVGELAGEGMNGDSSTQWHSRYQALLKTTSPIVDATFVGYWRPNKQTMLHQLSNALGTIDQNTFILSELRGNIHRIRQSSVIKTVGQMTFEQRLQLMSERMAA